MVNKNLRPNALECVWDHIIRMVSNFFHSKALSLFAIDRLCSFDFWFFKFSSSNAFISWHFVLVISKHDWIEKIFYIGFLEKLKNAVSYFLCLCSKKNEIPWLESWISLRNSTRLCIVQTDNGHQHYDDEHTTITFQYGFCFCFCCCVCKQLMACFRLCLDGDKFNSIMN